MRTLGVESSLCIGSIALVTSLFALGCGAEDPESPADPSDVVTEALASDPLVPIGTLSAGEASGVVASRKYPGVMWWHRDGGPENGQPRNAVFAYRIDGGKLAELSPGVHFKAFPVAGQTNQQWEDIATDDDGNLWVGQIGSCSGCDHYLLELEEPDPYNDSEAQVLAKYPYTYPGAFKNAEALLIVAGVPYIFSKESNTSAYRMGTFSTDASHPNVLTLVGALAGPAGKISGIDLSRDGRRLAVQTHGQLWVHDLPQTSATGLAFVQQMIATPPTWHVDISAAAPNFEGVGFVRTGHNLSLVAEAKQILFVPSTFYEGQPM
jgi:hypothetical protein